MPIVTLGTAIYPFPFSVIIMLVTFPPERTAVAVAVLPPLPVGAAIVIDGAAV